jgi:energy-coupling factor transporter ATP-binding protein EcfA2
MSIDDPQTHRPLAERATLVDTVFTPATPIQTNTLFAGRASQVERVYSTMLEPGRHVVLYGERGVGKTSLANIVNERLARRNAIVSKASADSDDSFESLWSKVFGRIVIKSNTTAAGFLPERREELIKLSDDFDMEFTPDTVINALSRLPFTVIMIDEFDRLESTRVGLLMADTIKGLSDAGTGATILIVGVADSVSDLVGHHPSIERSIREIRLQRMAPYELEEILDNGFDWLQLQVAPSLKKKMVHLSHGFPHYTHVLGRYAALHAIEHSLNEVTETGFHSAVKRSIEDTYQSIQDYYLRITIASSSPSVPYFLLAAAVAPEDEYGAFYPHDLMPSLREMKGKFFPILPVQFYINRLAADQGGNVFQRIGRPKNRRYRFRNPLMKPYIIMRSYSDGIIGDDALEKLV